MVEVASILNDSQSGRGEGKKRLFISPLTQGQKIEEKKREKNQESR